MAETRRLVVMSWPGLSRPSRHEGQCLSDRDHRDKPGDDDEIDLVGADLWDGVALIPAIDHDLERLEFAGVAWIEVLRAIGEHEQQVHLGA